MQTIRERLMASIQGVINEDGTKCDECGAIIWGGSDLEIVFAEHDEEECMVGANLAALYLVEHVTGNESDTSRKLIRTLNAQESRVTNASREPLRSDAKTATSEKA